MMRASMYQSTRRRLLRGVTTVALLGLVGLTTVGHSPAVHAAKIGGVSLPDTLDASGTALSLNGAGTRKRLFIKLYVGGLYLADPSSDAAAIIAADEPMAIHLHIRSDLLTKDKMLDALKDGFNASTGGDTSAIDAEIQQMIGLMQDNIRPKDTYTLMYEPNVGTRLVRNDEEAGVIEGLPFKQALFGIWLSDKPAQASLKKAMLGGG